MNSKRITDSVEKSSVERRRRLRRLPVLVVVAIIGVHVMLVMLAGIWVIARYIAQPKAQFIAQKQIKMDPEERQHRLATQELESLRPKPVYNNRITSLKPTTLSLPELPKVQAEKIAPIDTAAAVASVGEGAGKFGQGKGGGGGFFGEAGNLGNGLLEGTLYDLKKDENGRPTKRGDTLGAEIAYYKNATSKFAAAGFRESTMRGYYHAPQKLYLSQLAIPVMDANAAPHAYKSDIEPKFWVIVYRGMVTPPKDGVYRFAGSADDVLAVRLNNRLVLEASLKPAKIANWESRDKQSHRGGWGKEFGDPHDHVVYGDWIPMKSGHYYPIEIFLGECPGGAFYANLHIQEKGTDYAAGPDGRPVLPLFRLQADLKTPPRSLRPVAENGPIFKAVTNQSSNGLPGVL